MRYALASACVVVLLCTCGVSIAQEDVADVPNEDLRIAGNDQQRYFLIGASADRKPPEKGYSLLLVLPGGDGSTEFNPFVKRIWKHMLPEGFIVAQLVAVPSTNPTVPSTNSNQIVWPTEKDREPKQEFKTEAFIRAVVNDVKQRHPVDDARVYALAWSSGGPATYASILSEDSPLKGAFVAMSVFVPSRYPPVKNAKGKPFFLLQSPQDQVTKYLHATRAEKMLKQAEARVELVTYSGGHGWHPEAFQQIGAGVAWLEQSVDAALAESGESAAAESESAPAK